LKLPIPWKQHDASSGWDPRFVVLTRNASWFNHERLHEALGDIPPVEFEALQAPKPAPNGSISVNRSVATLAHKPADGLTTRRFSTLGVDLALDRLISAENAFRRPSAARSRRATGRSKMRRPPVASPPGRVRSLAGTQRRKPTNHVSVDPVRLTGASRTGESDGRAPSGSPEIRGKLPRQTKHGRTGTKNKAASAGNHRSSPISPACGRPKARTTKRNRSSAQVPSQKRPRRVRRSRNLREP
jgi:hypothetical protein